MISRPDEQCATYLVGNDEPGRSARGFGFGGGDAGGNGRRFAEFRPSYGALGPDERRSVIFSKRVRPMAVLRLQVYGREYRHKQIVEIGRGSEVRDLGLWTTEERCLMRLRLKQSSQLLLLCFLLLKFAPPLFRY